ncbi:MAG: hypothetical protein EBS39_05945 [Gammaproteobacteria bacterium]|nr:hypothetical protein [Gammaproteobacteria bacterium]
MDSSASQFSETQEYPVAVVGGAAAGTFFVAEWLRRGAVGPVLWLTGDDPVGVAYGTRCEAHLLNVPAAKMGAFADRPQDFLDRLRERAPSEPLQGTEFVPRRLYGDYLRHLQASARAHPSLHCLPLSLADIEPAGTAARPSWRLRSVEGRVFQARRVVFATGLAEASVRGDDDPTVIRDPWRWFNGPASGRKLPADHEEILVLGSGLTAMDVIIGLREAGFGGRIRALSRSGRWSERHAAAEPLTDAERASLVAALLERPTCRGYLATLRRHAGRLPWRAVIDALRPQSQALWSALDTTEQRRFLRHLFPIWNRHRHRAPPRTAESIDRDAALSLERGRWHPADRRAALVFDCRGLGLATGRRWPRCLTTLAERGVLAASALGIGFVSRQPDSIDLLGALRFGAEFECTAVPELRAQAAAIIDGWTRTA